MVPNLSTVLNWSSTFQRCVKMVIAVKCWMEKADVANGLFLILKIYMHASSNFNKINKCQLTLKFLKKKFEYHVIILKA